MNKHLFENVKYTYSKILSLLCQPLSPLQFDVGAFLGSDTCWFLVVCPLWSLRAPVGLPGDAVCAYCRLLRWGNQQGCQLYSLSPVTDGLVRSFRGPSSLWDSTPLWACPASRTSVPAWPKGFEPHVML